MVILIFILFGSIFIKYEILLSRLWVVSQSFSIFESQKCDTAQESIKERSKSPDATSVVTAGSQSPGPSGLAEDIAPEPPGQAPAGPSSDQSEALRVILRHYAWQYEWHLSFFFLLALAFFYVLLRTDHIMFKFEKGFWRLR